MNRPSIADMSARRKFKNYLLQPLLQVKLGIYFIVLSLIVSIGLLWFLYYYLSPLYDMVLELTDLREEVGLVQASYLLGAGWMVAGSILLYFFATIAISIFFTHRLIGPTYAFRRHIQSLIDGDYGSRVNLRKNDAFPEVANDLNRLAEHLQSNSRVAKSEGDSASSD